MPNFASPISDCFIPTEILPMIRMKVLSKAYFCLLYKLFSKQTVALVKYNINDLC